MHSPYFNYLWRLPDTAAVRNMFNIFSYGIFTMDVKLKGYSSPLTPIVCMLLIYKFQIHRWILTFALRYLLRYESMDINSYFRIFKKHIWKKFFPYWFFCVFLIYKKWKFTPQIRIETWMKQCSILTIFNFKYEYRRSQRQFKQGWQHP